MDGVMVQPRQPDQCEITYTLRGEDVLLLAFHGQWQLYARRPAFSEIERELVRQPSVRALQLDTGELLAWDTTFVAFMQHLQSYCDEHGIQLDRHRLPPGAQRMLELAAKSRNSNIGETGKVDGFLSRVGKQTTRIIAGAHAWLEFSGEVLTAMLRMLVGRARYRFSDVALFFQQAGPEAVPIVTLIGVLVGLILAFVGSIQLRIFGAELFVANLVGVGMTREMGAMMTAVIMAGRTGAAYAAQLGSMQVNEEVDALRTMGVPPVEYLVLPRLLGLVIAMPLLYLYANVVGIAGGFLVGVIGLDIGVQEYLAQTASIIRLNDVLGGLFKSLVFGVLIALAGCLRGMQCGRSSAAVGEAATSAVVAGIVFMVVADAFLTILYDMFGV